MIASQDERDEFRICALDDQGFDRLLNRQVEKGNNVADSFYIGRCYLLDFTGCCAVAAGVIASANSILAAYCPRC